MGGRRVLKAPPPLSFIVLSVVNMYAVFVVVLFVDTSFETPVVSRVWTAAAVVVDMGR